MADINNAAWSQTDDNNNGGSPSGFPEGMAPSGVNNSERAVMGAVKRWHDQISPTVTSGGSANAQTLGYAVPPAALAVGDEFAFIAGFTNTGAMTLDVGAGGALNVVTNDGIALTGGEVRAGEVVRVSYSGSSWQLETIRRLTAAANGFIKLPGGIIVQWGSVTLTAVNTAAVLFPLNFPTAVWNVQTNIVETAGNIENCGPGSVTLSGFNFNVSIAVTTTAYWFAIGN